MKYRIEHPRWEGYKVEWRNAAALYQVSYWEKDEIKIKYFHTKEEVNNYIFNEK